MHYGVDYYPEHDPEARWAVDAPLIAKAGFSVVRLAEFAWSRMEPEAGCYDFAWLDRAIDVLAAQGLQIVLGTPTAAPPQWLAAKHPEILYVDAQSVRAAPQSRRFVCLSNPVFRAASEQIVQALAERYGQHSALVGWQIDNEFGCHGTTRCFCESCQTAFCEWLRERYTTLAALNEAWGTMFWSQEYSDWSQVRLPAPTPTYHNPSHVLDSYRFATAITAEYQQLQATILRAYSPGLPVCHNFMANFDQLNYTVIADGIDLVAWDNYVADGVQWQDTARFHAMMRGYKHKPFWVIESPPGHVNWTSYNPDLRPGEARLRSLQAVAHGADGIFYFQWRAFRAGGEQYHSAILPHDGIPGRLFAEASALGAEVAALRPLLAGTQPQPKVAILVTMDSYWALQYQPHNVLLSDPQMYVRPWHQALCRRNIAVEFCQPTDDLSAYALVIAPLLHVVDEAAAEALQRYVAAGGTLVLGPRTGFKLPTNQVTSLPLPGLLHELAGVRVAEWAALLPDAACALEFGSQEPGARSQEPGARSQAANMRPAYQGQDPDQTIAWRFSAGESGNVGAMLPAGTHTVTHWRELLELHGAEALAHYTGRDAGQVAITTHRYGAGMAWYVGVLGDELIDTLLAARLHDLGIGGVLATPVGVEACERSDGDRRILFLLNHTDMQQHITLPDGWCELPGGSAPTSVTLEPCGVRIMYCSTVEGGGNGV